MQRPPRWLRLTGYILGFLLLIVALIVIVPPYRSLPKSGGTDVISTLTDFVAVQRDRLGVVSIKAAGGRRDVARATGYVHAQERFFQMDLLRRVAAGELTELFGAVALPVDRRHRTQQLRHVARQAVEQLLPEHRELVEDYTIGVNAGLAALSESPFEYLLLRAKPAPWKAEDSMLVIAAMSLNLQPIDGQPDRARGTIRETFTPEVADFLLSQADAFEAALDGSTIPLPAIPARLALRDGSAPPAPHAANPARKPPAPNVANDHTPDDALAARLFAAYLPARDTDPELASGSNAWAIAGSHANGVTGILASDVHLGLGMPNIFFRVQFMWTRPDQKRRTVTGASLPGTPAIVLGSNGDVAWALTSSYIDTSDVVIVETDPADPKRYRTPDGWKEFVVEAEMLNVKGAAAEALTVTRTIWGPVIDRDAQGRPLVLHWVMGQPEAYNLQFLGLEEVASARAALAFAKSAGMPQHNFLCADRDGDIAWTIAGRIPRRIGTDGFTPASWADGTARWDGWLATPEYPQVVNPPDGRLWTANSRALGGSALARLGDGDYPLASRSAQIRERLFAKDEFTAEEARAIQYDDRGRYLERWQQLLVHTLSAEAIAGHPARAELKQLAENWGGRAVPDSAGYRLVRDFRAAVKARVMNTILAACQQRDSRFELGRLALEEPVFALVAQQPDGWLPEGRAGWNTLLLAAVDATIAEAGGAGRLAAHTWGKYNRLALRHPLSAALPLGRWLLDLDGDEAAGDSNVVCALSASHGPAERMVIMPGREEESFFHMPGGQSGNPLSSHYSDSYRAWLKGEATPFLPGKMEDHLVLQPLAPR